MRLSLEIAKGALNLVANLGKQGFLSNVGVTVDDYNKLSANVPWIATDRVRVKNTLDALMFATIDTLGLPRFQVPAEYIAAAICVFVAPCNIHVACRFFERVPTADSLARGVKESDPVTAEQLFALITGMYEGSIVSSAKETFRTKTSLAIETLSDVENGG